jgi:hypothetical protein
MGLGQIKDEEIIKSRIFLHPTRTNKTKIINGIHYIQFTNNNLNTDDDNYNYWVKNKSTSAEEERTLWNDRNAIINNEVINENIESYKTKEDILKYSCKSQRSHTEMRKYCVAVLKLLNHNPHIYITTQDIAQYCKYKHI